MPYGPERYNQIVQECYLISKSIHTSYKDLMDITPHERSIFLKNMKDEYEKSKEMAEKIKSKKDKFKR